MPTAMEALLYWHLAFATCLLQCFRTFFLNGRPVLVIQMAC